MVDLLWWLDKPGECEDHEARIAIVALERFSRVGGD